jgi:hypothetical protein
VINTLQLFKAATNASSWAADVQQALDCYPDYRMFTRPGQVTHALQQRVDQNIRDSLGEEFRKIKEVDKFLEALLAAYPGQKVALQQQLSKLPPWDPSSPAGAYLGQIRKLYGQFKVALPDKFEDMQGSWLHSWGSHA